VARRAQHDTVEQGAIAAIAAVMKLETIAATTLFTANLGPKQRFLANLRGKFRACQHCSTCLAE
jgi:hypothetical protein